MSIFETPTEEASFSALVDQALRSTGRSSSVSALVGYANATIRECDALGLFADNGYEEQITATADPHIYTRPTGMRSISTVNYGSQGIWPKFLRPGKQQRNEAYYFYRANSYYAFKGPLVGEPINLFNYYWLPPLRYYKILGESEQLPEGPYGIRPAYWHRYEKQWYYLNSAGDTYELTLGDEDAELAAQIASANWLVIDWWSMILEGVKAKAFASIGDDRSRLAYSLYKDQQKLLKQNEYEAEGY